MPDPDRSESDHFEVARQFPIGDMLGELANFPVAGGYEMVNENVAHPVARNCGLTERG